MKPDEKHAAITALAKHDGWALIKRAIDEELMRHLDHWSENRPVSASETDFRRGCVFALRRLQRLPEELAVRFENEYLLALSEDEKRKLSSIPRRKAGTTGES